MINVEQETRRVTELYRHLTGSDPRKRESLPPLPPEVNPAQFVEENLTRLNGLVQQGATEAGAIASSLPTFVPRINVLEGESEWRCSVELPGIRREEVALEATPGTLQISAQRASPPGADGSVRAVLAEAPAGRFIRVVPVPQGVRLDSLEARMENGVLTVKARKEPASTRKQVKVEVA